MSLTVEAVKEASAVGRGIRTVAEFIRDIPLGLRMETRSSGNTGFRKTVKDVSHRQRMRAASRIAAKDPSAGQALKMFSPIRAVRSSMQRRRAMQREVPQNFLKANLTEDVGMKRYRSG